MEAKKKGELVEGSRILAEIGRGAASIIYLVQDEKTKQIWALKHVQKTGPKDQRFLDQAEKEYNVAKKLDHPGIRKIPRLIKKKQGLIAVKELFLVMELVDGIALDKHPPKTFEQAVFIFQQIAEGMAHMHDRGFVHADMKPNNIVVSETGIAKIIDLGQSCEIGTIKKRIQGTPDYIAPEQVHRRAITPKTDIYNLGATMYWVLTRKHVPTALGKDGSLTGSIEDHLVEKPADASELNPRIPDRLNELVMQCVQIDEDDRPDNMHTVADGINLIHGILLADSQKREGSETPTI